MLKNIQTNLAILAVSAVGILGASNFAIAKEKVTLTINTHDSLYINYFKTKVDGFKRAHSNYDITFKWQQVPENQKMIIQLYASRQAIPDIVGLEQSHFAEFTLNGLIDDLFIRYNEYLSTREINDIIQSRRSIYTCDKNLYGIESALTSMVYYYQPRLLQKYNLSLPKTYTEMINQTKQLRNRGVKLSFIPVDNDHAQLESFLLQRGAHLFDKNGNFVLGNSDNKRKALEVLKTLQAGVKSGAFLLVSNANWWDATLPTLQKSGKLVGILGADWWSSCCLKPRLKEMHGQWAIAQMPKFANGGHNSSTWGGTGFAISKNSPHKDLALQFIKYAYLSPEAQYDKFKVIKMYPVTKSGLRNPDIINYKDSFYQNDSVGKYFVKADIEPYYQTPNKQYFIQAWNENSNKFLGLKMSAEDLLNKLIQSTEIKIEMNS